MNMISKKNWFNIGGKSKVFYKAENLRDLINFLKLLDNNEKIFVLGWLKYINYR